MNYFIITLVILLIILLIVVVNQQKRITKFGSNIKKIKDESRESEQVRNAYMDNINKQITESLNTIDGVSSMIDDDKCNINHEEYVEIIRSNKNTVADLLDNAIYLSKIENGEFEIRKEKFDLVNVLEKLKSVYANRTNSTTKVTTILPFADCIIDADKTHITQTVSIMISNALKLTLKGTITIGYTIANDGVKIYVSDTGKGMDDDEKEAIFKKVISKSTTIQMISVGYIAVKNVIKKLGGNVGIESELGKGSLCWIWIPTTTDTNAISDNDNSKTDDNEETVKPLKILIAEDTDSNYRLMEIILRGHRIDRAENGLKAIEKVHLNEYDLILMDIRMPEMDGLEATKFIRKNNPGIPIIAITANAFDTDKDMALKAGCNGFLTKPLDKNLLYKILNKIERA